MQTQLNPPVIVHAWNPFNSMERDVVLCKSGADLLDYIPQRPGKLLCTINGEPISRESWDCNLEDGDIVVFRTLPHGGGNSNPFQVILAIVLIVVGVVVPGAQGLIYVGAGLLAVSLIPTPKLPLGVQPVESPSPTYNVALAGNSARVNQPIPVPYGRHQIYPDFVGQPYTEFIDNDAYYHACMCLGNTPDLNIESIQIDDTSIDSFEEVQTQIQGQRYTPEQTLVSIVVINSPEIAGQTLESYRAVGPFAAIGPGLTTSRIGIDVVMPKGLYYANDDGTLGSKSLSYRTQAQLISNLGEPIGAWVTLGEETQTAETNTPQRRTHNYIVPSGRYQIRMQRTDTRDDNTRAGHDVEWVGLRAFSDMVVPVDPNITCLAVRIRATGQLSGTSQRRISVITRRLLQHWHPDTGWGALQESRSIAWAWADALRNGVYGLGMPDNRIDLLSLYQLDEIWKARGDTFNGIFDKRLTIWNALTTIARPGRARPLLRTSIFSIVRDGAQSLPVAMFNMRNIQRNSFSVEYVMFTEDTPEAMEMEFFNETTWNTDSVLVPFPGLTGEPTIIQKGSLMGVTTRPHALRETAYAVADAAYRRIVVRFTTEMEGFLPSFGDLIAVSHDLASWGKSAEVVAAEMPIIEITERVEWTDQTFYALISDLQGDVHGPYRVRQGPGAFDVEFIDVPSGALFYTGTEKERTRISIGIGSSYVRYCRLLSLTPKENNSVTIMAVVEDARVHTSDTIYLPLFPNPRPGYFMAPATVNYNAATLAQKAGIGGWAARADETLGDQGDAGYYYQ